MHIMRRTIFCLKKTCDHECVLVSPQEVKVKAGGDKVMAWKLWREWLEGKKFTKTWMKRWWSEVVNLYTKIQWFSPFCVISDENPAYLRVHEGRCRHLLLKPSPHLKQYRQPMATVSKISSSFFSIAIPIRKQIISNFFCQWKYFTNFLHVPDSTFLSRHFKTNLIEIGPVKRKISKKNLFFANVNYTISVHVY